MGRTLALTFLICALGLPAIARAKPARAAGETAPLKPTKKARATKQKAPCYAPEVHVVRRRGSEVEHRNLSLTMCDGTPNPAAVDSVSVLARPRDTERPSLAQIKAYQRLPIDKGPKGKRRKAGYLTDHVLRVHPGLLERLQRVAKRWPGKTIEIISGYRPDARITSRHHHGRALDMRVEGISREALRDFLRTFDATGVGYYPNSYFVHMDVREDRGYWVDRSGPGEAPDYGRWPPPKREVDHMSAKVMQGVLADLEGLREAVVNPDGSATTDLSFDVKKVESPTPRKRAVVAKHDAAPTVARRAPIEPEAEEEDELDAAAIERIRKQALEAVRGL